MRYRNKFIFFKNKFFRNPRFFKPIHSKSGRNSTGSICVLTKKHRPLVRVPGFSFILPFAMWSIFLKWTETSPITHKKYSIYEGSSGTTFILPAVAFNVVGSFYKFTGVSLLRVVKLHRLSEINLGLPCFIKSVPFFYPLSNLLTPEVQKPIYVVSSGTWCCKIPVDKRSKFIKIVLPSKVVRFFRPTMICIVGKNPFAAKKMFQPGKAGASHYLGLKSIVRGVAKNPVDHPNGGRTKSCSPERSPWGWVAKLCK